MAPEMFRSDFAHPSWDAYSLGVTAAVLLVGKLEQFSDLNSLHLAKVSGYFDSVLLEGLRTLEHEQLRDWCQSLLDREPSQRVKALREM